MIVYRLYNNFVKMLKNLSRSSNRIIRTQHKKCFSDLVSYESYEKNPAIGILSINNPKKRNALSYELLNELKNKIAICKEERINSNGKKASIIIVSSQGPIFSSGHDLKQLSEQTIEKQNEIFNLSGEIMVMINKHPSIFIGEIQGLAAAAGCQLALSCDIVIASSKAAFSTPGIKLGFFCTTPSVALSRVVSPKRALEMLLTGEEIPASKALDWGMVNRIANVDELDYESQRTTLRNETLSFAEDIAKFSHKVSSYGKEAFYNQLKIKDLDEAYKVGACNMVENFNFADCKEGVKSFIEKRKPKFNI